MGNHKLIKTITATDNGGQAIVLADYCDSYYVTGTPSLTTNWAITASGTAYQGMRITFEYAATFTLNGNTVSFLGTAMPTAYAAKKVNVDCYYNGSAWIVDYQPAFNEDAIVTSAMIDSVAVAKITGTASKAMEFTAGGVGQASATTAAELAYLAGVTAGTAAVNKAVVLTTGKNIDELDITTFKKGGTTVTSTAAELNKLTGVTATTAEINVLAGVTAGTASPSKAVVLKSDSTIDTLDITNLYLNGMHVDATGDELSELNSAGVVKADFEKIAGLNAAGVTAADLALLAGAAEAGVTAADVQAIQPETAAKVQIKTDIVITDATIDEMTGLVILTLTADTNLTLPNGANTKQVIDIIIKENAASAYDVTFLDSGATFWSAGSSASNSITVTAPPPGSLIKLSNCDTNVWIVGTAS